MQAIIAIYRNSRLPCSWLHAGSRILLLVSCIVVLGCATHTPPPLTIEGGGPADKYDYLLSAISCHMLADSKDADVYPVEDFHAQAEKMYHVWLSPDKFDLEKFPAHWDEEQILTFQLWHRGRTLESFETLLGVANVYYREDVRRAIDELKRFLERHGREALVSDE